MPGITAFMLFICGLGAREVGRRTPLPSSSEISRMESHAEAVRLADAKAARMLGVIAASIMKNPGEPKFRRLR